MAKKKAANKQKAYKILSLDGGGIRGLMSAVWLKRLQEKLSKPLNQYFDLVAGTSTGALLACGISKGISIDSIIDLYIDKGELVFPHNSSRLWERATRLFTEGVSGPKFDGTGLDEVLKETFHTSTFGSLKIKPTIITAYDVLGREAVVFKNNKEEHQKLKVWEICRASSAAPTFFPAHVMKIKEADLPLVDGGVVATNPTACAIAEAVKLNTSGESGPNIPLDKFIVASFGTGESTRSISIEEAKTWGPFEWAVPLVNIVFDGSSDSVNYIANQLITPGNYFRFQTLLSEAFDDLDDASQTNMNSLIRLANKYIESADTSKKLDELVERLEND